MVLTKICPFCDKHYQVHVPDEVFIEWQNGKCIQDAWPDAKPETREMVISGICLDCQGEVFNDEL